MVSAYGNHAESVALADFLDYIRDGIRSIAEDLCTRQIGHRNQMDAMEAERREIQQSRYTSLDRLINRASAAPQIDATDGGTHFVVSRDTSAVRGEFAKIREHHIAARLIVLQKMGLAEEVASGDWLVRQDFEGVLRAMQRVGDRLPTIDAMGSLSHATKTAGAQAVHPMLEPMRAGRCL